MASRGGGRSAKAANSVQISSSAAVEDDGKKPKADLHDLLDILPPLVRDTLFTQRYFWYIAAAVLLAEAVLTFIIITRVPYTEIDFSTYMQQANLFLVKGQRDYSHITGDTGPCVYPAGHLYFYSAIHWITRGGKDLRLGQYIFGGLYLLSQALVMAIYHKAGAPAFLLPVLATSKRLHSIYALRLFNDGVAMTIMFSAILLLAHHKYRLGVIITSLALSVKMNILLFIPALAVILFRAKGFWSALNDGLTIIVVQVLVSLPFSLSFPKEYLSQAFDLTRQFLYKWTVNLRFLPEEIFLDKRVSVALLLLHASLLTAFGLYRWTGIYKFSASSWIKSQWSSQEELSPKFIIISLFTSNLIGILCARSLHYQFYSWYAQSLPLLLWSADLRASSKALLPFAIEMAWNTYPSTQSSSFLLCASNAMLLVGLFKADIPAVLQKETTQSGGDKNRKKKKQ